MLHSLFPIGVHVFERGWLSSNNVLCVDSSVTALIDSGYSTHSTQTVELCTAALGNRSLDLLINTHLHSDHCGGNAALQIRYPELRTLIPPGQASLIASWDQVGLSYAATGQTCPRFTFDGLLSPGAVISMADANWEIHAAAGHDPHSIILFEPSSRTLISADALWEDGFGIVFPELEGENAFEEVAATLDMIEKLAPSWVVPGHGPIFRYRPDVMGRSRQRLDAFVKNPQRHARHAAKVLLKFKLLELQQVDYKDLLSWAESVSYFQLIRKRFFPSTPISHWVADLIQDLIRSGAATKDNALIFNA
jgi:glyoxylase-like metal-dependent hydrolase (beta-lactamase superfamily II)